MSKDYTKEIGYESLLFDFKRYQKQTPRGVGMVRKGQNIYLQFKTPNTARKPYACNCSFTLDGMVEALKKANQIKEKLKSLTSETEFWQWYNKEVKNEFQLINDQMTFIQAIIEVERDFWSRPSRTKRKRDKASPSDQSSWYRTYGCFYKHLPEYTKVNFADIKRVIDMQNKGTRNHKYVVSAMKKLAEVNHRKDIHEQLSEINTKQTEFMELQTIDVETFLNWRDKTLKSYTSAIDPEEKKNCQQWMWVFSTQLVYALRISEVFAIANLTKPYVTKDGVTIPALNDPSNTSNLIYIGDKTILGTTVKTGSRIARPQVPPKYPSLLEILDIKNVLLPNDRPTSKKNSTVTYFFPNTARKRLLKWNAPFTQTHADRHLGNLNGMQAGIPLEIRAQSMGHTPAMNDSGYKKRVGTKTKIDLLLNSNTNAIDFVTALTEIKRLVTKNEVDRDSAVRLLSIVYQKDVKAIDELL